MKIIINKNRVMAEIKAKKIKCADFYNEAGPIRQNLYFRSSSVKLNLHESILPT